MSTPLIWSEAEKELARRLWCDGVGVNAILKALVDAGFAPRARQAIYEKRKAFGWPERSRKGEAPVGAKLPGKRRLAPPRLVVSNPVPKASGPGTHLMDLRLRSCRWPLWGDKDRPAFESMRFCGEPAMTGLSYCPACAAKASGGRIDAHTRPEPGFRLVRMGSRR